MGDSVSLLHELRAGGYEASLITTFNAYLPFYEEVVLRRLVNSGIRHNVLLMDAAQYGISSQNYPPVLAGRQYTLAPINMPGAFHPKLILLVGKKKALIAIGSHNMTLSGFGFSRELTNVIKITSSEDASAISLLRNAWQEVESWLQSSYTRLPNQVKDMVLKVETFAPWINKAPVKPTGNTIILGGIPGAADLWSQLSALIHGQVIELSVFGAFFDRRLGFIERIKSDLGPNQIYVAVDPHTVKMPAKQNNIPGVKFVSASKLGESDEGKINSERYLHAKGIYLKTSEGQTLLATGSANPSAPAWLANETRGNVELMVVRMGAEAEEIANKLAIAAIPDLEALSSADWEKIAKSHEEEANDSETPSKRYLAVVEEDRVIVDGELVSDLKLATGLLFSIGSEKPIAEKHGFETQGDQCFIRFPIKQLSNATMLRVARAGKKLEFLLHHQAMLEEQARTGIQRQFKTALLSLETDTPNFDLLISCLDRIIFSSSAVIKTREVTKAKRGAPQGKSDDTDPGTLAIDASEVKQRKAKQRLLSTGDFAYLLDALIYHLKIQEDKSMENLDRRGRSEEEQVDADDADEDSDTNNFQEEAVQLLRHCHRKVNSVVKRMIKQFNLYDSGKQTFEEVMIRLLGVLAVFRELRRCDKNAQWVGKGETTVPLESRKELFEAAMYSLFDGKFSLLHLEKVGEKYANSDELARLKGLLIWLAWDCGKILAFQKPFNESREDLDKRLVNNAMLLALAQTIEQDEITILEARQSIGTLTTTELEWLKALQTFATECAKFSRSRPDIYPVKKVEPGDVAVHKTINDADLRIVASVGQHVSLVKLSRDKVAKYKMFTPESLCFNRCTFGSIQQQTV